MASGGGWRGNSNRRGRGYGYVGYKGSFATPPDVQRQLDAANAAVQAAQQSAATATANAAAATATAAAATANSAHDRQVLQHMMAMNVAGGAAPRPHTRRSLQPAAATQSSSSTKLVQGPGGYLIHPTLGTMPHIVPPRVPSRASTAPLQHATASTMSAGYAHPSLGVMPNVTVPVPVQNAALMGVAQSPLTAAPVSTGIFMYLPAHPLLPRSPRL